MNTSVPEQDGKPFTGRHMIYVLAGFFGTIIAVNLLMAVLANRSWTGLVVKNSYVASQHFNEKLTAAQAQAKLGWTGSLAYGDGRLVFRLADREGEAIHAIEATAAVRRPIHERDDRSVLLQASPDGLAGQVVLEPGVWDVDIDARLADSRNWIRTFRIHVPQDGS